MTRTTWRQLTVCNHHNPNTPSGEPSPSYPNLTIIITVTAVAVTDQSKIKNQKSKIKDKKRVVVENDIGDGAGGTCEPRQDDGGHVPAEFFFKRLRAHNK